MSVHPCLYTTAVVPGAPAPVRDSLLRAANNGVRFLFDLAFGYSYPGGPLIGRPAPGNPVNGAVIYDVAGHANGTFVAPGTEVTYAGGGFDFSAVTARENELRGPSSALDGIITGDQEFAICSYLKLPALADWYTGSGIIPLFCTTSATAGYVSEADLVSIGYINGGILRASRTTTALGAIESRNVTLSSGMAGKVSQVLYWRDAVSTGIRVRNSAGTLVHQAASGAPASVSLGTRTPRWGVCRSLWDFGTKPSLANANKFRLYRGWIEDLQLSGRNALEVADADYERTMARVAFS